MPYVVPERRASFEISIHKIVQGLASTRFGTYYNPSAQEELKYIIFSIIKRYIEKHGMRYHRAQDFIGGVLTCCRHELLRRFSPDNTNDFLKILYTEMPNIVEERQSVFDETISSIVQEMGKDPDATGHCFAPVYSDDRANTN